MNLNIWLPIFSIIIVAVIGVIGWLLKEQIKDLKDTDKRIEGKIDKIGEKFSKVEIHNSRLVSAIVEIQGFFTKKGYPLSQNIAITPGSPLRLTEYGEQLIDETGFNKILSDNKIELINLVKGRNPQTNYDIQEYSTQVMKELVRSNNPIVKPLKEYAFQKGLMLDIILDSAGIVLRDEVMKELKFNDKTLP